MKRTLILLMLGMSLTAFSQEKRQISNYSASISDSIFTLQVAPFLDNAIKLMRSSNIPSKEANLSIDQLNAIGLYIANDIERQKKEALEAVKVESSKVKKSK